MATAKDYLPASDAGLLSWSANFSSKIATGFASFGLTSANATAYAAKQVAFASALTASTDPLTRGPNTVLLKNQCKAALVQISRQMAMQVTGTMTVTNAQRQSLNLTVRAQPQPIPPPGVAPALDIVSITGRTVRVRLHDADDASRRRPAGVTGCSVFSYVGATPPADTDPWKFEGSTTSVNFDVQFPMSVAPGTQVWVTAFWTNSKRQGGPACTPIGCNVGGGGAAPIAA